MIRLLIALFAIGAYAQVVDTSPRTDSKGTALPATCVIGQRFFKTDATAGQNQYGCTATNTWTQLGGSGAVASVTAGATGGMTCTPTTGAVVCDIATAYVPSKTGTNVFTGANDFSTGTVTAPVRLSASAPATCTASTREMYFNTTSNTLWACTATNTWSAVGSSSGWPAATVAPTYVWRDFCRDGAGSTYGSFSKSGGGDFDENRGVAGAFPICTARLVLPTVSENGIIYSGDGGDKVINRLTEDWDITLDVTPSQDNVVTQYFGVQTGLTWGNDACWVRGDRVDATTAMQLFCRNSGVDGTATTMTGIVMDGTRFRLRVYRVGSTVYATANGGTVFSVTTGLPTATTGATIASWIRNDVGFGGSSPARYHRWGFAY